jgi:hypothetical protein
MAAYTITFHVTNATGRTIPSVHGAGVGPQVSVRSGYCSGGKTCSCELTVSAAKSDSDPNVCTGSSASFLKADGTASAPTCSRNPPAATSADNDACTYVHSATMREQEFCALFLIISVEHVRCDHSGGLPSGLTHFVIEGLITDRRVRDATTLGISISIDGPADVRLFFFL